MNRSTSHRYSDGKSSRIRKLLSLPGIREAMELVKEHALFLAIDDVVDAAMRGELGDDLRELVGEDSDGILDEFLENDLVQSYASDSEDAFLQELALVAGPKIAELWELSEVAGRRLAELIYWGTELWLYTDELYWLPFVLIMQEKDADQGCTLASKQAGFRQRHVVIVPPECAQPGHIYLDVTYLQRESLLLAYRAVLFCRDQLQIRPQDLREGAPPSIDGAKALRAAASQREKGGKKAAKELGFRIYTRDNRAGSYPLFRKYARVGHVLNRRLSALEEFLFSVEDTLRKS